MKKWIVAGIAAALSFSVAGCASISKEECREGDWVSIGKRDGAEGHGPARLESHAKACGNLGITPDAAAYRAGWDQGILLYCTPLNGFATGRSDASYHGLCPAETAGLFLEGRQIGLALGDAERRVRQAENAISSSDYEIRRLEREIDALLDNKDMDKDERRERIRSLRDSIHAERDRQHRAEWDLRSARIEQDDMQIVASGFLARFGGRL